MTDYVSDAQARSLILDVGRRLYHSGFVASNDGNITCKVGDNAIWATFTLRKACTCMAQEKETMALASSCRFSSSVSAYCRVISY